MSLHLSFFAFDIGPARNLSIIAAEALNRQHGVTFIGNQPLVITTSVINKYSNALIMNIASFKNEDDKLLLQVWGNNHGPCIVVADTHGSGRNPAVKDHIKHCIAVVACPQEIEPTLEFGYKDAIYLGGPPLWRTFFSVEPAVIKPFGAREKYILVSGVKDARITDKMIDCIVKAVREERNGLYWKLILRLHPNEHPDSRDLKRRASILNGVELIDTSQYHIEQLIAAVDVSVMTGGSTPAITAAHLRQPVIYYTDDEMEAYMLRQGSEPIFYPATTGALLIARPEQMAEKITEAFSREGRDQLRKRQEQVYPSPDPDAPTPERQIIDFVESIA